MSNIRTSAFVIGWWIVAVATLGHAPYVHSQADPNCPTCGKGPATAPLLEIPQLTLEQPAAVPPAPVPALPVSAEHAQGQIIEDDCPVPIIKLKIRAPACAEVGKELEYRIKVENSSPADAHNVTVKMNLPASVKILRASPQVHQRDPELQWNLGTVPGHGCHDIVVLIVPIGLADIRNCTRVTFEHGQCVVTKVMALAPEGSADGRVPPGQIPGVGPGGVGPGGVGPGAGMRDFDVKVFGPTEAAVGVPVDYKITVFNKGDRPLYKVIVGLDWGKDLEEAKFHPDLFGPPIARGWPKDLIPVLAPGESRTLTLSLKAAFPGEYCVKAAGSANVTQNPGDAQIINAKDQLCTKFHRGIPGMTLEMFDRDDPILKNGSTSYPITIRNQGKDPITNMTIKALVPSMLTVDQVRGPGRYRSEPEGKGGVWVHFEPLPTLSAGETQTFEIFVKGKGQIGDARFHVEMTADQLDRGINNQPRWIIEEESTTLVPDEETRARIREISRKYKKLTVPGIVTSK